MEGEKKKENRKVTETTTANSPHLTYRLVYQSGVGCLLL